MDEYLTLFFESLSKITWGFCLVIFILHLVWARSAPDSLQVALTKAVSASGIPNGLAFLVCSIAPQFVQKMEGSFWAFFIGGLALIVVTARDIAKPSQKRASSSSW